MAKEVYKKSSLNFYEEDKEVFEFIKDKAKEQRLSVNSYILTVLEKEMERED